MPIPAPRRRPVALAAVTAAPVWAGWEAAPRLILTPNACPHAHQTASAGCWACGDCGAVLGAMERICSPWTPGTLVGAGR